MKFVHTLQQHYVSIFSLIRKYPASLIVLAGLVYYLIELIRLWYGMHALYDFSFERAHIFSMIAVLLVVFFGATALNKTFQFWSVRWWTWYGVLFLFAVWYYTLLPFFIDTLPTDLLFAQLQSFYISVYEHFLVQFVAIASVLVVPLYSFKKRRAYNLSQWVQQLLLYMLMGWLFGLLLAWWLAGALQGIKFLFDLSIAAQRFNTIFAVVGPLFWWMVLLHGIDNWEPYQHDTIRSQPRKNLLLGVIVALVIVYGLLLYTYLWSILIQQERPSNQVWIRSFLFAWLIMLASLFLMPFLYQKEWKQYRLLILHWLYILLFPVLAMIGVAVRLRIQQYGFTEARYGAVLLLLFLLWTSLYMLFSHKKDLWVVSVWLLFLIMLWVFWWPLSARWVSVLSQSHRLSTFSAVYQLTDWMTTVLVPELVGQLPDDVQVDIASIVTFLAQRDPIKVAQFTAVMDADPIIHLQALGIAMKYFSWWAMLPKEQYWSVESVYNQHDYAIDISGFHKFYRWWDSNNSAVRITGNSITLDRYWRVYEFDLSALLETVSEDTHWFILTQQYRFEDDTITLLLRSMRWNMSAWIPVIEWILFDFLERE